MGAGDLAYRRNRDDDFNRRLTRMKYQRTNRRILGRTVCVFTVCLLIVSAVVYYIVQNGVQKEKDRARYTAEAATRRVGAQINKYLVVSDIMKKLVRNG